MKKSEKIFGRRNLTENWVEMKKYGLKIVEILGGSTY